MTAANFDCDPLEHYPNRAEYAADGWVHGVGLAAALVGGGVLLVAALMRDGVGQAAAVALYGATLVAMLACSAAYNLSRPSPVRPFLRKLDQAAIFLLIAGSYTPFTSQRLEGGWAVGMTALVWALALAGVAGKLLTNRLSEKFWCGVYLAFGCVAVVAAKPLWEGVPLTALALLAAGGAIYTAGVWLFLAKSLPFRRALWHGFVVVAAGVQQAAIWTGVVLAS
jgi:hemolysin III